MAEKSLFDSLIDVNDKLHEYAAELITETKVQEDIAVLPLDILNKVLDATIEGLAALSSEPKLKAYKDQFALWSEAPANIVQYYKPQPTDKTVTIPVSYFQDLIDPVLNQMANLVHNAAIDSIGPAKKLKSCKIAQLLPDNAIPVGKYCSGAKNTVEVTVTPEKKFKVGNKTFIQNYPQLLIQPLGVHKVMPSVYKSGDEIKMAVEYHDSYLGHVGSANRLRGTRERLEMLGFDCSLGKTASGKYKQVKDIYCNIDDIAPNTIRELATFFSLLLNGDIAHSIQQNDEMYPVIRDKAWEKAVAYNAKYGDNVWESPMPHQLDWDELAKEWQQEQQYTKNPLYNDLRQLLYLRDIHHMIEEKYNIDAGAKNPEAMKQILENGIKAQKILLKNHWGNIQHNLSELQAMVDSGKAHNIAGVSDAIGHQIHAIVYSKLINAGSYGHCIMDNSVGNISAGNLAYCEGILAGTKGSPIHGTGGNGWSHNANPNTFSITVGEDYYPDFEYALKVNTQGLSPFWTKEIQKALHQKFHFNCSGQLCSLPTEEHSVIRKVAAFLSNLRGADEKIGEECAKKAIEDAYKAANEQVKKGEFTFTQSSIFNYPKEWVDKCFKEYGITPVGMSKEEEAILKLIGANKVYGGCSFGSSDILPDLGVIKYCEGVRQNPQGKINAWLQPNMTLDQYFHETTDKIAGIKVETEKPGLYSVSISNLNMRDKIKSNPLQKAVVSRLKSLGYVCPDNETCSTPKPISEDDLRFLATYLSSFHQAYNVPEDCIPKAEQFVFDKAQSLKTTPHAYKQVALPHYQADWVKDVCGPEKPKPEAVPTAIPVTKYNYDAVAEYVGKKHAEAGFPVGMCQSYTKVSPTQAKAAYCLGIPKYYAVFDKQPEPIPGATAQLYASGEGYHTIKGVSVPVVFSSSGKTLFITLPKPLQHNLVSGYLHSLGYQVTDKPWTFSRDVGHYLVSAFKAAMFLSQLTFFDQLDEDCKVKAVENAMASAENAKHSYIYPYTLEDWKSYCAGGVISQESLKDYLMEWYTSHPEELSTYTKIAAWLKDKHPNIKFPASSETAHEKLKEEGEIISEADGHKIGYKLAPKEKKLYKPSKTGLIQFVSNVFANNPNKVFSFEDIFNLATKAWFVTGQEVLETIKALQTEGFLTYLPSKKYTLAAKPLLLPVLKETLLNFLFKNHEVPFSEGALQKVFPLGYELPTVTQTHMALEELVKDKKIVFALSKGVNVYKWVPLEAPAKTELYEKISKAVQEHLEENAKLQQEWNEKSDAWKSAAQEKTAYKKLPKLSQDILHNVMDLYLLTGYKEKKPYDQIVKELQKDILKMYPALTPLMVKLQTDIEKKAKINLGLLPECDEEKCELKSETYETMTESEKEAVKDWLTKEIEEGPADALLSASAAEHFGIKQTQELDKLTISLLVKVSGKSFASLTPSQKDDIKNSICLLKAEGKTQEQVFDWFAANWEVEFGAMTKMALTKIYEECPPAITGEKPVVTVADINEMMSMAMHLLNLAPNNKLTYKKIFNAVAEKYSFSEPELSSAMNQLVEEGKVKDVGKTSYQLTLKGKKEAKKVAPELKAEILSLLSAHPGMQTVDWITENTTYEKMAGTVLPTKQHVQEALDELTQEGKLLWEMVGNKYQIHPEYETKPDFKSMIKELFKEHPEMTGNDIHDYLIGKHPSEAMGWMKSDVNKAIAELHDEGFINWDDTHLYWTIAEEAGGMEGELTEPSLEQIKTTALQIIEQAAYDFDWSLEYILDEFDDYGFYQPDLDVLSQTLTELIYEAKITYDKNNQTYHSKMMHKNGKLVPIGEEMVTHYSDLDENTKTLVDAELKLTKDATPEGQEGAVDLHKLAAKFNFEADQSLFDAYEKLEKTPKEEKPSFSQQSDAEKDKILKYVTAEALKGKSANAIMTDLEDVYYEGIVDDELTGIINGAVLQKPEALIQEEAMSNFVKMGMDAQAIQNLFAGGTYPQSKLKSTSEKLYKLYHTDEAQMTFALETLPTWVQQKIASLAENMLMQGKTQEDTTWYISYHFHVQKEPVKALVKELAKKPVVQQKQLLETTVKILSVGQPLAGCVVGDEDLEQVTASTVAYCQGVIHSALIPEGEEKPKAETEEHGTRVKHQTWTQAAYLHTDVKNGGRTTLKYDTSALQMNSPERNRQLARILSDFGFECQEVGLNSSLQCGYALSSDLNLPIEDQDNIRKVALLISSIDKVAALPVSCIPKAMEYAKNHAVGINKTSKPWTVNVFPETVEDWEKLVCSKVKT